MMAVRLLKNIPYFSQLTIDEMCNLVASSQTRTFPRGSIVLRKGEIGEVIYLIIAGTVKVVVTHTDGKEIILNTLKSGDFFGEMAIFDNMPRSATVAAVEDCELLIISRDTIIEQIKKNPPIAFKLLSDMSRRVREADEQIFSLAHLDEKGRVAQTLLKLANESNMVTDEGYRVFPKPTVHDIAAMSGTSRKIVVQLLDDLSKKGIIGLSDDYILILEQFGSGDR